MAEITSMQNPLVKRIRSLKLRKHRQHERCFWAEGIRIAVEALDLGWDVEALVWAPELLTSDVGHRAVAGAPEKAFAVSGRVFRSLSSRDNPQGLGALVRVPERRLEDVPIGPEGLFVVLEEAQDPGNVGTAVRTADCAGCAGVILLGNCADPYAPQAIRASMGSLFSTPVVTDVGVSGFISWAEMGNLYLLGTSARAASNYLEADCPRPMALLFGSEQKGLSEALRKAAHAMVHIPIRGRASSLNLSSAVAVMAYHVLGEGRSMQALPGEAEGRGKGLTEGEGG